jgi:hypothetical protein
MKSSEPSSASLCQMSISVIPTRPVVLVPMEPVADMVLESYSKAPGAHLDVPPATGSAFVTTDDVKPASRPPEGEPGHLLDKTI